MTATSITTTTRTASGWTLALWTTLALVVGAGVGSAATVVLDDDGPARTGAVAETDAGRSSAVGDLVSPEALDHRIAASGRTAVVSPLAAAGVFTADAAEHRLVADADERLELCTSAVVAADAVEHCLTTP